MNPMQIIGMCAAIAVIVSMAVYSGMKAKGKQNHNGTGVVAGVIMGTLVGGSSTVGTAQLAYNYGMSAWWFTLGGGIGCLLLAFVFGKAIRHENVPTLVGIIRKEYGERAGMLASVLSTIGTFINIIAQLIAASAVVVLISKNMNQVLSIIIPAVFMVLYVIFGGTRGAGIVGIVKLVLLYISMVVCGGLALSKAGGYSGLIGIVSGFCEETGINFFSVLARGAKKDLGAGLSLLVGVLTTQTYAQGIICGKTDRDARNGALISAVLIPIIGIFGIIVGLYMRSVTDPATFSAKTALTRFVLEYLPPAFGGIVLGALFIASVGTGAGLALGIATILLNDVIKKHTRRYDDPKDASRISKVLIAIVLSAACLLSTGSLGDLIMSFSFMSMGLRGAVVFAPLCGALWFKRKIKPGFSIAAIICGPLVVGIGNLMHMSFDPLFAGMGTAILLMAVGSF